MAANITRTHLTNGVVGQASELDEAEEVLQVIVGSDEHASGVLQPRVQSLNLPPTPVTPERSAVLRRWPDAVTLVWRDELDPALGKISVQRITVVSLISNQPLGKLFGESTIERGVDECCSCG